MIAPTDFNIDSYVEYLQEIGETHVITPALATRPPAKRWIAIQHDVDLSLVEAVRMGCEEAEIGVQAVYNVQVGCAFYDLTSPEGQQALRSLVGCGHTIGLHFDHRRYTAAGLSVEQGILQDREVLGALGFAPPVVCAHKPLRNGDVTERLGKIPTPQVEGEVYVSDSARGFSNAGVKILESPPDRLRINFHPAWWQDATREEIVEKAAARATVAVEIERRDWADIETHPHAIEQDAREQAEATV